MLLCYYIGHRILFNLNVLHTFYGLTNFNVKFSAKNTATNVPLTRPCHDMETLSAYIRTHFYNLGINKLTESNYSLSNVEMKVV